MIFEDQNSGCCEKEHTSSARMSISLNDAIAAGSFQFGAQSCRLSWMSQAGCEAGQLEAISKLLTGVDRL